jgi:hypothetical protein
MEKFKGAERKEVENFEEVLAIKVMRHGPKETAEGEKDDLSDNFESSVLKGWERMGITEDKEGLVHLKSSHLDRALKTAAMIENELSGTSHRLQHPDRPIEDKKLASVIVGNDVETLAQLQTELKSKYESEIDSEGLDLTEEERETELRNRIDTEFLTRWIKDDNLLEASADDLADGIAIRYAGFAQHLSMLKESRKKGEQPEDEAYLQIDVSHSFPTMLFLKKYMVFDDGQKAANMDPEEFFERTDGIISESGSFEMSYGIDDSGMVEISVKGKFKNKDFSGTLSTGALLELYNKGKKHINVGE